MCDLDPIQRQRRVNLGLCFIGAALPRHEGAQGGRSQPRRFRKLLVGYASQYAGGSVFGSFHVLIFIRNGVDGQSLIVYQYLYTKTGDNKITASEITTAVTAINRVEKQMIRGMSDAEYRQYRAIPAEDRKQMLYMAYKLAAA